VRESSLVAIVVAALAMTPAPAAAEPAPYVDLTQHFVRFADMPGDYATRVAAFRMEMNALLPGFYAPRNGLKDESYDRRVARALSTFPQLREKYLQVQRDFPAAYQTGIEHFRKVFRRWSPSVPVYFVHSLGEMDGGMRTFGDQRYLIFGADVIAQIHDARTLTPFLSHELFHVENSRYFDECGEVWCSLWAEGLATYAAKVMNPGADDEQLLLTAPAPIRAATDARWREAVCFTRSKLDSSAEADFTALFVGSDETGAFPQRFGYYVALRAIEALGGQFNLPKLASMKSAAAKQTLTQSLDGLIKDAGGCPQSDAAR
jgi:hypothetical protein